VLNGSNEQRLAGTQNSPKPAIDGEHWLSAQDQRHASSSVDTACWRALEANQSLKLPVAARLVHWPNAVSR
jgi:hypothetical protein